MEFVVPVESLALKLVLLGSPITLEGEETLFRTHSQKIRTGLSNSLLSQLNTNRLL
jgi:hypothetical protein